MSTYTVSYSIRYLLPPVYQQIESAAMHIAETIMREDPLTPDHANRMKWAQWAVVNSSVAAVPHFGWPVAFDRNVEAAVLADPTGLTVKDADVQAAAEKAFPEVLTAFLANPPPVTAV
jgi:hypothetical protein